MSHFDLESWSDYVRGAAGDGRAARMRRHLDDGCAACAGKVAALSAVKRLADGERRLGLAPGVVRATKAMYRQRRLAAEGARATGELQLVYDSWLAPPTVGVRSAAAEKRSLIYMSDSLSLDLQLLPATREMGPRILGEIVARDSGHVAGTPVALLAGNEVVAEGVTGRLGDFAFPAVEAESLRLRFELDERLELELPPAARS